MKTVSHVITNLNDKFKVVEINSTEDKEFIKSKIKINILPSGKQIYTIVDQNNNILFTIFFKIIDWGTGKVFESQDIYYDDFHTESFRLFYIWIKKIYHSINIDKSFCQYENINFKTKQYLPLSIWEENGILNEDLYILRDIDFLPKNLTIKGNLYMENSTLSYLGNGLKVEGNIHACNSQLSVIDDSVKVKGKIYTEDSLLISYPTSLGNKIVNPKRMKQVIRDF